MAEPFLAEIRLASFAFAPTGWAFCNGQLLPISQNTALFSLLGTTYGGDGRTTFGLPNLQGSSALGMGNGPGLSPRTLGETGGEQTVTLISTELPIHTHAAAASNAAPGTQQSPTGNVWSKAHVVRAFDKMYDSAGGATMNSQAISPTGGNLPHNNMPPYLVLNFCIALQGVYPTRS